MSIHILDGGMGHELKLRGISDGSFMAGALANEDTNGSGADIVESIHFDFLSAGCDIITTNSFVAVPLRMIQCGLTMDDQIAVRVKQIICASVDRARAAIARYNQVYEHSRDNSRQKKIAGCVPPLTECYLAHEVPASVDELIPGYTLILSTLIECKVDILLSETLSTAREALAILQALHNLKQSRKYTNIPPLWVSFTVHDHKPIEVRSGEALNEVCQTIIRRSFLLNIVIEAIGINCSSPSAISCALPILTKTLKGTNIKCICYANCFQTSTSEWICSLDEDDNNKLQDTTSDGIRKMCKEDYDKDGYLLPLAYSLYTKQWADAGATIIGGCCGCRPEHMKRVASILR